MQLVEDVLSNVTSECKRWLSKGLPSSDEIQQRFTAVAADFNEAVDVLGRRTAEMDAEDAERRPIRMERFCCTVIPAGPTRRSSRKCVRSPKKKTHAEGGVCLTFRCPHAVPAV